MSSYYSEHLNAENLKKCYAIAPPRVKQFLEAEIDFVLNNISGEDIVLDLGCGYGRVAVRLSEKARQVVGIDISASNIRLAKKIVGSHKNCAFYTMDASQLDFSDNTFTTTICVQNGISAFKTNPRELLQESIRVTKKGGIILYSSYAEKFWEHRLEWFRIQSDQKLIGEIDWELTKNGVIVCKDGFKATTYSGEAFLKLAAGFNVNAEIIEIDNSSIFCRMKVM